MSAANDSFDVMEFLHDMDSQVTDDVKLAYHQFSKQDRQNAITDPSQMPKSKPISDECVC